MYLYSSNRFLYNMEFSYVFIWFSSPACTHLTSIHTSYPFHRHLCYNFLPGSLFHFRITYVLLSHTHTPTALKPLSPPHFLVSCPIPPLIPYLNIHTNTFWLCFVLVCNSSEKAFTTPFPVYTVFPPCSLLFPTTHFLYCFMALPLYLNYFLA